MEIVFGGFGLLVVACVIAVLLIDKHCGTKKES